MNWYEQKTNDNDIAISTRIRLARNIAGMPFPSRMTPEAKQQLNRLVRDAIQNSNTPFAKGLKYIAMKDVPENERYAMVERHIISREFVSNCENRAIILSEDETVCIMLGEEDHIRIQVVLGGLQPEKAYDIADSLDRLLCDSLDIAFDGNLGFLTECPTNLGTGLRASVMLHLPMLESGGGMQSITASVDKIGFVVRGMYGEGSRPAAAIYQLSNQITLGITEKNAIDNLKVITNQIIARERELRENADRLKLEDTCMRALGVLRSARIIDSGEMMQLLSRVKLGISSGVINEDINTVKLLIEGQPYMLMKSFGVMSPDERDIYRATMLRNNLEV